MVPAQSRQHPKSFEITVIHDQERTVEAGEQFLLPVCIENHTGEALTEDGPHPLRFSYHWHARDGSVVVFDGKRTKFLVPLQPFTKRKIVASVQAPATPGQYEFAPALVREGARWFEGFAKTSFEVREALTPLRCGHSAREDFLCVLPKYSTGAELGFFRGKFSEKLIRAVQPRELHLVDPWWLAHGEYFPDWGEYTDFGRLRTRDAYHEVLNMAAPHRTTTKIIVAVAGDLELRNSES